MPHPIRTLVTGIANLAEPDAFLAPAVNLARRLDADLHVVHAYRVPEFLATFPVYEPMYQDLTGNYASELKVRLETVLHAAAPGVKTHAHVVAGPAGRAVAQVADDVEADLVVVGRTRHGTVARALLGTTAERVLRESARPVLLLADAPEGEVRRVLLPTDLSEQSAAVYETGLELVESLFGTRLQVASLLVVAYGVVPPPLPNAALATAGEVELNAFLGRLRPREDPAEPRVRLGSTPDCIVAEAHDWEADLLVMGTHGRSRFQRYFLGSVAEATLRAAPCSVLVLPPTALKAGDAPPEAGEAGAPGDDAVERSPAAGAAA